ncbi:MAG: 4a-hydroxytetrahydrobiopterin dehydratase [Patescibacteria group bacterium]
MLKDKNCVPCEEKTGLLNALEIQSKLKKIKGWELEDSNKKISKIFSFLNFSDALIFINRVGEIAEDEAHHPDILLFNYNKVKISLSTHSVKGLTENDFIVATKIKDIS